MENWTAYFAPQQADPIPIHCRDAVPGAFSPVRVNASAPQQLSGLLYPPSGFRPVRLSASTRSHCSCFQSYSLCASLFSFALI